MENKKELSKIALAGLLLAVSMPIESQATENVLSKEVYLAVAGCPASCGGLSTKQSPKPNEAYSSGEVADSSIDKNQTYQNRAAGGSFKQTDDKHGGGTDSSTSTHSKTAPKPVQGDR